MSRFRRSRTAPSGSERTAAAFSDLVARHRRQLLQMATRLEGGSVAGEELLQGALARTWNHFETGWDDARFVSYVRVAMVNAQRSQWRRPLREDPYEQIDRPGFLDDAQQQIDDADELDRVLGQLSERQREVVVMRYYDDLSELQTAQALSCSVGTVKSQTSRAIARLRRLLDTTRSSDSRHNESRPLESQISDLLEHANDFAELPLCDLADDSTGEFPALV